MYITVHRVLFIRTPRVLSLSVWIVGYLGFALQPEFFLLTIAFFVTGARGEDGEKA